MSMSVKERFIKVLSGVVSDRLPVTTHHLMPYFLKKYMKGIDNKGF